MFFTGSFLTSALIILEATQSSFAVCASGQMAVGRSMDQGFSMPARGFNLYSGFLMSNNCKLISQNGETQSQGQLCKGGYFKGASITCDDHGQPTAAVDTMQQKWKCSPTEDDSCNIASSGGGFVVLACCDRA